SSSSCARAAASDSQPRRCSFLSCLRLRIRLLSSHIAGSRFTSIMSAASAATEVDEARTTQRVESQQGRKRKTRASSNADETDSDAASKRKKTEHKPKKVALFLLMANVNDEYMEKSKKRKRKRKKKEAEKEQEKEEKPSGGGPERDHARLVAVRQLKGFQMEETTFVTFNLDIDPSKCHPNRHFQGDLSVKRTAKELLQKHECVKNLEWLMIDYLRAPNAYLCLALTKFMAVTLEAFVSEGIIGKSTAMYCPNFLMEAKPGEARCYLESFLQERYRKGIQVESSKEKVFLHIDALTREDAKQQFPLYAATEKMSETQLSGYTNQDAGEHALLSKDVPFIRVTLHWQ
ncbi:MAG: hypothetical protein P4M11_12805, partial [Candidatus Pacebacteria bacterium]|nr:hypothetical protein [Candidatus Paceibacterota bacterium]